MHSYVFGKNFKFQRPLKGVVYIRSKQPTDVTWKLQKAHNKIVRTYTASFQESYQKEADHLQTFLQKHAQAEVPDPSQDSSSNTQEAKQVLSRSTTSNTQRCIGFFIVMAILLGWAKYLQGLKDDKPKPKKQAGSKQKG